MSERKTAEIKFRCTPSFKSNLQAAAEAAGQSMSEFIESAVWALQNQALDSLTPLAEGAVISRVIDGGVDDTPLGVPVMEGLKPADAPARDCACKPWEFCRCKAKA